MRKVQSNHSVVRALFGILVVSLWATATAQADCDHTKDPLCSNLAPVKLQTGTHTVVKHGLVLDQNPKPRPQQPIVYVNPPQPPDQAHNGGGSQPHSR
jgi:hypothetical protein